MGGDAAIQELLFEGSEQPQSRLALQPIEGTAQEMWDSLAKLAALPGDTLICCGHEYTESNARSILVSPRITCPRGRVVRSRRDRGGAPPA